MSQTLDRLLCEMHRERLHSTRDLGLLLYVARCGGRAEFWAVERASGSVPHLVAQTLVTLEEYGLVKLTRTVGERPMIDIVELAESGWDRVTELTAVIIAESERAADRGRWPYERREGQEGLKGQHEGHGAERWEGQRWS